MLSTVHRILIHLTILEASITPSHAMPMSGLVGISIVVIFTASKPRLCNQLPNIASDRFLQQIVTEPTRITETTSSRLILHKQFANSDVVPSISDHEAILHRGQSSPNTRHQHNLGLYRSTRKQTWGPYVKDCVNYTVKYQTLIQ